MESIQGYFEIKKTVSRHFISSIIERYRRSSILDRKLYLNYIVTACISQTFICSQNSKSIQQIISHQRSSLLWSVLPAKKLNLKCLLEVMCPFWIYGLPSKYIYDNCYQKLFTTSSHLDRVWSGRPTWTNLCILQRQFDELNVSQCHGTF